jgi:hypothetical protein
MQVLTNLQIKLFYANLFKQVFIDLNHLTDPIMTFKRPLGARRHPQTTTTKPLIHYASISVLGLIAYSFGFASWLALLVGKVAFSVEWFLISKLFPSVIFFGTMHLPPITINKP